MIVSGYPLVVHLNVLCLVVQGVAWVAWGVAASLSWEQAPRAERLAALILGVVAAGNTGFQLAFNINDSGLGSLDTLPELFFNSVLAGCLCILAGHRIIQFMASASR